MTKHDEGIQEVYYIPENYDEAGGMFSGHISQRNGIELTVLCGPLAFAELKILTNIVSLQTFIIIFLCTILPLAALCIFGIRGESLSQILFASIRFRRNKRRLSYQDFSDPSEQKSKSKFDSLLDDIATNGLKGALSHVKENASISHDKGSNIEREAKREDARDVMKEHAAVDYQPDDEDTYGVEDYTVNPTPAQPGSRGKVNRVERKQQAKASRWMNSALKEKILERLELGDDEEYDL